jgi:hypothetical protein
VSEEKTPGRAAEMAAAWGALDGLADGMGGRIENQQRREAFLRRPELTTDVRDAYIKAYINALVGAVALFK